MCTRTPARQTRKVATGTSRRRPRWRKSRSRNIVGGIARRSTISISCRSFIRGSFSCQACFPRSTRWRRVIPAWARSYWEVS